MPTPPVISEDLLAPIPGDRPAGVDLRPTPEWDKIKDARRADDLEDQGAWKRDRKTADWPLVERLATAALTEKTKDLQIAIWLTEACIKLYGFAGLRDSLQLIRELLARFWDSGLYPPIEDGDLEFRAGPLEWLNEKMAEVVRDIPITVRKDGGEDYSLLRYQESRRVGSEQDLVLPTGDIDAERKTKRDADLAAGRISVEMYDAAVRATRRTGHEALYEDFQQACREFEELDRAVDEKFGSDAPGFSDSKAALEDCRVQIERILQKKREEEPDPKPASEAAAADAAAAQAAVGGPGIAPGAWTAMGDGSSDAWLQAENLVRTGQVQHGLAEMTRLAAKEPGGRARFHRKLMLAEICLSIHRERLAIAILEELAEQIDKLQLETWESPELVGRVWSKLYRCYNSGEPGTAEAERAAKLFERLCRLDPWQALACGEG